MKFYSTLMAMICAATAQILFAQSQGDNPNLDQIPMYIVERASEVYDAPLSSVVTVGNWDNYSLGVDFAESNMAMNPLHPNWFFTAYNTNATHHSENGIDWAINNPSFGATMRGDPVVAYDSIGNLFYENMYGSTILGCKVIASSTNGVTWGTSVTAIAGNDKNWIACDQTAGPYANYVYTTMTNNGVGNFARSTNHGVTFTSTFAPATQTLPGMMVCVGPQGNTQGGAVYVVTNSGSSFAATYTFYRSNDGGATFTQRSSVQWPNYVGTNVDGRNSVRNMRTRPYPMIAADNSYGAHRGKLYCVYASNNPSGDGNKPDIFCRTSSDGGATWGNAIKVNDDINYQFNHQWHPSVWCDKQTGRLYVMWMDTRDTPTSDSAYIYASYSETGGASFVANQRISNVKMKIDCSTCGGGGTPRYQGDYNGVVSNKKVSMIGWTDFRVGTFQSMTAYFPDFAMAIDHLTHTLYTHLDSAVFQVSVPSVKLYADTVLLTTTISPTPATGLLYVTYPSGNSMTVFPGSKPVNINLWGNVPAGNYTVTFTAASPNGTPVHKRAATITVAAGNKVQATATMQPNRTVCVGDTIHVPIHVTGTFIHNMVFYITYDHASLSQSGTYYSSVHPAFNATYNPAYNETTLAVSLTVPGANEVNLTNAKVIDLIFTVIGIAVTPLHFRTAPDTAPVCGLWNSAGTQFTMVSYTDKTISAAVAEPVSVTIASNPPMPVCENDPVSFQATVVNGGTSPVYQWTMNSMPVGTNAPFFNYMPVTGDQVQCLVTSNAACASVSPVGSNILTAVANPLGTVGVTVSASENPVLAGTPVTFTAISVNGGTNPIYDWHVNGESWGNNNPVFIYNPENYDLVNCVLVSSQPCTTGSPAYSNMIAMTVYNIPQNIEIQNLNIGDSQCYDAIQTITVGGNGSEVNLLDGSQIIFIAGGNIAFLPNTSIASGAYVHGYITTNGSYCGFQTPAIGSASVTAGGLVQNNVPSILVYPNPTNGVFRITLRGVPEGVSGCADMYNSQGVVVYRPAVNTGPYDQTTLPDLPDGLYYLRISAGAHTFVKKIILQK